MSNDAKFWATRIGFWTIISIDASLLLKMLNEQVLAKQHIGIVTPVLFVLCIILTVYVAWQYYCLKSKRWVKDDSKTQAQIEVEALAAYAAEEQRQKEAQAAQNQDKKPPMTS